jgi:hypothetical protein
VIPSLSELVGVGKVNPAQAAREALAVVAALAEVTHGEDAALHVYLGAAQTFALLAVAEAMTGRSGFGVAA